MDGFTIIQYEDGWDIQAPDERTGKLLTDDDIVALLMLICSAMREMDVPDADV